MGTYGAGGYDIAGGPVSLPAYATVSTVATPYTWAPSSSDARAVQVPGSSNRVAAAWYTYTSMTFNVSLTGSQTHQVALYFDDWDGSNGRQEKVEILGAGGTVLDTRVVSAFSGGEYLVWNLGGSVQIRITDLSATGNAVMSAIFVS